MQEEGALPWETPSPGGTDKQRKHRPSSSAMSLVAEGGGGPAGTLHHFLMEPVAHRSVEIG